MQRVEAICCENFVAPAANRCGSTPGRERIWKVGGRPDDPVVSSSGLRWKQRLRATLVDVEETYRFQPTLAILGYRASTALLRDWESRGDCQIATAGLRLRP